MPKTRSSSSGGGALFATGTYTGDGAATQAIAGVGFQPKVVIIYGQADLQVYGFGEKNDQDGLYAIFVIATSKRFSVRLDMIVSLDADGFTVGDGTGIANTFNINLRNYTYICFG